LSTIEHASVRLVDPPERSARIRPALRAAQVLMLLLSLPMTVGGTVFGLVQPDDRYAEWVSRVLGSSALLIGLGLLASALVMFRDPGRVRQPALYLLAAAETFNAIKLIGFHEGASVPFILVATAALVLVLRADWPDVQRS
jgi:hypothetical protein